MSSIKQKITGVLRWKYAWLVAVVLAYVLFTFYYMTPSVLHCTDTVYGFGDNTAGVIWPNKISNGAFLPNKEYVTNYPDGEELFSAINVTSIGQRVMYWPLAKIAGPICGYNLWNILAFTSTALITFGFIFWLTRNKWIAFIAGYAVAFVPYMQMKTGPHPSYGFSGIFVGLIWLLVSLLTKPTRHKAIFFALLYAFCVYFDPYFVLYGTLASIAVVLAWLTLLFMRSRMKNTAAVTKSEIMTIVKALCLTAITVIVLLSPLLIITAASSADIQKKVSAVRGNVLFEATACANYPHEYLLPFVLHPLAKMSGESSRLVHIENKLKNNFSCGIGEDTVGVSLTIVFLVSITSMILIWEYLNKRLKIDIRGDKQIVALVLITAIFLLIIGILFGLPPAKYFGVPTPTKLLLEITTTWRTLARTFMLVNIAAVILFALALKYYSVNKNISKKLKIVCFVILFVAIFVEYQAFPVFKGNTLSTFSYKTDVPQVYESLAKQQDIKVIAEYPMESYGESDVPSYYLTMQYTHGKKLLNGVAPYSSQETLRKSVKNINDPQTLPALAALGVDAVVLHGLNSDWINKNTQLLGNSDVFSKPRYSILIHTGISKDDKSTIVKLQKPTNNQALIGLLSSGFFRNLGIINYPDSWAYEAVNGATIDLETITDGKVINNTSAQQYCFDIRSSAQEELTFTPVTDGVQQQGTTINNAYVRIKLNAKDQIILKNDKGANMQVTNLGCRVDE